MLTPLCCFAVTTPSSSQSLKFVLLSGVCGQLLDRQIHAVSRLYPDQILTPLNHRRCFAGMCMLYKIHSNPKHCLCGELPPACQRARHTRAAAVVHPREREVPGWRTSQLGRCFLPAHVRMWNDLHSSVFDSGTLSGLKGAVNLSQLL